MCLWLKASKQADQAVRSDHAKPKAAIVVILAYPLQCLCLRARGRALFFSHGTVCFVSVRALKAQLSHGCVGCFPAFGGLVHASDSLEQRVRVGSLPRPSVSAFHSPSPLPTHARARCAACFCNANRTTVLSHPAGSLLHARSLCHDCPPFVCAGSCDRHPNNPVLLVIAR